MPSVPRPAKGWRLDVLGSPVDPLSVAYNGSRHLHAIHRGVCYDDTLDGASPGIAGATPVRLALESLDVPLVAPGDAAHLIDFDNQLPELAGGFHFNLHNNAGWDQSAPQWYGKDAAFRFRLNLNAPRGCWPRQKTDDLALSETFNGAWHPPQKSAILDDGRAIGLKSDDRSATRAATKGKKPNFLVLFLDDHGWGDLGANADSIPAGQMPPFPVGPWHDVKAETPHMDALAASGIRFTDFHVGFSVCAPSRAALLTGRLCTRTGVCKNFSPYSRYGLASTERTMADILGAAAGYDAHMIGKW